MFVIWLHRDDMWRTNKLRNWFKTSLPFNLDALQILASTFIPSKFQILLILFNIIGIQRKSSPRLTCSFKINHKKLKESNFFHLEMNTTTFMKTYEENFQHWQKHWQIKASQPSSTSALQHLLQFPRKNLRGWLRSCLKWPGFMLHQQFSLITLIHLSHK